MRICNRLSVKMLIGLALAGSLVASGGMEANATTSDTSLVKSEISSMVSDSSNVAVLGLDGVQRAVSRDSENSTSYSGLSSTVTKASTDSIVLSDEGKTVSIVGADGAVYLTSSDPTLESSTGVIESKFAVEGNHIVITPIDEHLRFPRSGCASSLAGSAIYNIGMAGVCAMLGVATAGVGGVICEAAVIAGGLGINWDSQC